MPKDLIQIQGFDDLQNKLKKVPDKVKRKEVIKILRRASRDTVKIARSLAPKDTGQGEKSIKFEVLRRSKNPAGIVGPRSRGKYDGYYLRLFVIPGHNIYRTGFKRSRRGNRVRNTRGAKRRVAPVPFMQRAYQITQGKVSNESVTDVEKYIQKQIERL